MSAADAFMFELFKLYSRALMQDRPGSADRGGGRRS